MCRNIRPLFNFAPPATKEEIESAALQYVRKITGTRAPTGKNIAPFARAVAEIAKVTEELVTALETRSPPKNREQEALKAKALRAKRFP